MLTSSSDRFATNSNLFAPGQTAVPVASLSGSETATGTQQGQRQLENENQTLAIALEMLAALDDCVDVDSAGSVWLGELAKCVEPSDQWFLVPRSNGDLRIAASQSRRGDDSIAVQRYVIAAAEEATMRGTVIALPAKEASNRYATLACQQLQAKIGATELIVWPMHRDGDDSESPDCVMVISGEGLAKAANLLAVMSPLIAARMTHLRRMQRSMAERWLHQITHWRSIAKRQTMLLVGCVVLALAFLPTTYNIRTDCVLQPIKRRFVSSPIDGSLLQVIVRPGDSVQVGQKIAEMDPRRIDFQLAGLEADLQKAEQDLKQATIQHDSVAQAINRLEAERLRSEVESLRFQKSELSITSPVDGMIVSGDWKPSEGTPLTRGEVMFEIAPLEKMNVEIRIDERDFNYVKDGMKVQVSLDAVAGRTFKTKIDRLHPQAELIDGQNVFIADAVIDAEDAMIRPGMRGRTIVASEKRSVAWIWLHKPYQAFRRWIAW